MITVAPQSGVFTFEADAIPSAANPSVDAGVGLANTLMTAYSDVAAVLRFHHNGLVDARNGSAYQAENNYAYTLGTTYHDKSPQMSPAEFERELRAALGLGGAYTWIYGYGSAWQTGGPQGKEPVAGNFPAFVDALQRAKSACER